MSSSSSTVISGSTAAAGPCGPAGRSTATSTMLLPRTVPGASERVSSDGGPTLQWRLHRSRSRCGRGTSGPCGWSVRYSRSRWSVDWAPCWRAWRPATGDERQGHLPVGPPGRGTAEAWITENSEQPTGIPGPRTVHATAGRATHRQARSPYRSARAASEFCGLHRLGVISFVTTRCRSGLSALSTSPCWSRGVNLVQDSGPPNPVASAL